MLHRCGAFRQGGSTIAPTVSIRATLPPKGEAEAAFCISLNGEQSVETRVFDLAVAKGYLQDEQSYYNRFWKIIPKTSDISLNCMYKRSLYQAYICGISSTDSNNYSVTDMCILLHAALYVDSKSARRHIIELICNQDESGKFEIENREAIYVAALVADYAELTRDYGFFDEYVPFKQKRVHGKMTENYGTVAEHCLRAVDYAICFISESDDDIAHTLCRDKVFIETLHYYSELCKNNDRRERYFDALSFVAARYAQSAKDFKACNFFCSANNLSAVIYARALNLIGEHDKAYSILYNINPVNCALRNAPSNDVLPYMFCKSSKDSSCGDGEMVAALFFITVTEQLFGLRIRGNNVKISPCTAYKTPDVEFDLSLKGSKVHVVVDDSEKQGEWSMRVDKIDYGIKSFGVSRHDGATVTFYRKGEN